MSEGAVEHADENGRSGGEIQKEIRFAVVMYGGVSLAIYMNGISQELLNLVWSTQSGDNADATNDKKETTRDVYREIAADLERQSGTPVKFVVDILSGTSAGGINAVFLAKALARGSQDISDLERTWLDEGDIDKLLNDQGSEPRIHASKEPKTSLLNSQRMYAKLVDAFENMERNAGGEPLVKEVDLFVTATDLRGIYVPIQLNDGKVNERVHKHVFPFFFKKGGTNDFQAENDPMLAFASRCTSSFPAAFEPMALNDIAPRVVEKTLKTRVKDWSKKFFRPQSKVEATEQIQQRLFADGGYLDNFPFGHAINAIHQRFAAGPVDRKLLFIDPFPDLGGQTNAGEEISFVSNLAKAAMTLPRYETIRGDIETVNRRNRWLHRVDVLMNQIDDTIRERTPQIRNLADKLLAHERDTHTGAGGGSKKSFSDCDLETMLDIYGEAYASYHFSKVYAVTDDLARMMSRAAGYDERSDLYRAIRSLAKLWRKRHYTPYRTDGKDVENQFLTSFDLSFRIRRLHYFRRLLDQALAGEKGEMEKALRALGTAALTDEERRYLQGVRQQVREGARQLHFMKRRLLAWSEENPLHDLVVSSGADLKPLLEKLLDLSVDKMEELEHCLEEDAAPADMADQEILDQLSDALDYAENLTNALQELIHKGESQRFKGTGEVARGFYAAIRAKDRPADSKIPDKLYELYRYAYEYRDSLVFPLLASGNYGEGEEVEIYRISPIDADFLWDLETQKSKVKLAGDSLAAFGGFLDREWRKNDIMWGRLDGAERLVAALLPGEANQGKREAYVERLHRIILKENFAQWLPELKAAQYQSPEQEARFAMIRDLNQSLDKAGWRDEFKNGYFVDTQLPADESLKRVGRASRIFASMVERLNSGGGRVSGFLNRVGQFLLYTVDFTMPKSVGHTLSRYWLQLIMLVGVLLTLLGSFLPKMFETMFSPGVFLIVLAVVVFVLREWLTSRIHTVNMPGWLRWTLKSVAAILVLAVFVGLAATVYAAIMDFPGFWNWLKAVFIKTG